MSSDIYAKPDFSKKVRYNRQVQEDRSGWEEREVDIYQNADAFKDDPTDHQSLDGGPHTQSRPSGQKTPFRAAALGLGVLSFLMMAVIIILTICYVSVTLEKDQLETRNKNLSNNYKQSLEQLSANNRQLQDEVKRLKEKTEDKWCPKGWTRFGSSCYVQLNEKETWSDSKKDCKNRGGDLVVINSPEEQEFLLQLNKNEESWIGLKTEQIKGEWRWRWRWVDGSELTHTFWSTESDGNPNIQDYATCCDRQGKWKRHRYYEEKGICEINLSYFP